MGVRINGVWHEELADPGTGGSDEGAGREFSSAQSYNTQSAKTGSAWGENLNTYANPETVGGGNAAAQAAAAAKSGSASSEYGAMIQKLLEAQAAGDAKALAETVREFDAKFGLDTRQFEEGIRQYNQNYLISQAGLTGTYQGQPTLPALQSYAQLFGTYGAPQPGQQTLEAQNQAANFLGTYQGAPTLQAQLQAANLLGTYRGQQTLQAQQQAFQQGIEAAGLTGLYQGNPTLQAQQQAYQQGLGVVQTAASLQANPFRQQQVLGQAGRLLAGNPVPGFTAPNVVSGVGTAGGNQQGGLGYLNQIIEDIRNPTPNQTMADQFIANTPTPNKINSQSFLNASPSTQNILLQAMQEKYGIDPNDALQQIKNTLPAFQAPNIFGTVK